MDTRPVTLNGCYPVLPNKFFGKTGFCHCLVKEFHNIWNISSSEFATEFLDVSLRLSLSQLRHYKGFPYDIRIVLAQ